MRITRYYCPRAHETFSLLPDCLASCFPGDRDDLERVVAHVDAARSIEAAADVLRPEIVLPSTVRCVRRRLMLVRATLLVRHTRRHALEDILVITLCAVICGADDWVSIAHFGHAKRK